MFFYTCSGVDCTTSVNSLYRKASADASPGQLFCTDFMIVDNEDSNCVDNTIGVPVPRLAEPGNDRKRLERNASCEVHVKTNFPHRVYLHHRHRLLFVVLQDLLASLSLSHPSHSLHRRCRLLPLIDKYLPRPTWLQRYQFACTRPYRWTNTFGSKYAAGTQAENIDERNLQPKEKGSEKGRERETSSFGPFFPWYAIAVITVKMHRIWVVVRCST